MLLFLQNGISINPDSVVWVKRSSSMRLLCDILLNLQVFSVCRLTANKKDAFPYCCKLCNQRHCHKCLTAQNLRGCADTFFYGPKWSHILSDEWLPRERRDKAHSVPFIPRASSSWFLTPWFNHQTMFHLVHGSLWAENLCRHEILTVCLCLPPGNATLYPSWGVSAQWRLNVSRQKSRLV